MTACPDDERLVEYVEQLLAPADARALEVHVDGCPACRELLARFAVGTVDPGATHDMPAPPEAHVFGERYELRGVVGTGAMSIVYAARDRALGREIALKVLRPGDPALGGRLVREARAMARLNHPNVLPIYDVGILDGRPYLTTELVAGHTVAAWGRLAQRSWREIVAVFVQAAHGLAAAHAVGIAHRDFKPNNVLIGDDGRVRVADFGLASHTPDDVAVSPDAPTHERRLDDPGWRLGALEPARTVTGALVGTPVYMAPEQLAGGVADARSDQYAYCASLFEALHGERPYAAASVSGLRAAIARRELRRRRSIPSRIAGLIERGLAVDPAARHASMAVLVARLERVLARPRASRVALAEIVVAGIAAAGVILAIRAPDRPARTPVGAAVSMGGADAGVRLAIEAGGAGPAELAPSSPRLAIEAGGPGPAEPGPSSGTPPRLAPATSPPSHDQRPKQKGPATAPATGTPGLGSPLATSDRTTVVEQPPLEPSDRAVGDNAAPAPVPAPVGASSPLPASTLPALITVVVPLGYREIHIDGDLATNLADLRARLATVPADERAEAVTLQLALGAAHRKSGDCAAAIPELSTARREAIAVYRREGELGRRSAHPWRAAARRAMMMLAYCKIEERAIDEAVQALEVAQGFGETPRADIVETQLVLGMLQIHQGQHRYAYDKILQWERKAPPALRVALRTWAKAVGVPLAPL